MLIFVFFSSNPCFEVLPFQGEYPLMKRVEKDDDCEGYEAFVRFARRDEEQKNKAKNLIFTLFQKTKQP